MAHRRKRIHDRDGCCQHGYRLAVSPMKRMTGCPGSSSSQRTSQSESAALRTIAHMPLLNRNCSVNPGVPVAG